MPSLPPAETRTRPSAHLIGGGGYGALLVALVVGLVVALVAGISIGTVTLPVKEVWSVVGHHLGFLSAAPTKVQDQIVWDFRTPRVLLAAVVGAALSVAGACLQVLGRNALADPYVLGVSSGASFGAVLVLAYGTGVSGGLSVTGAAFVAAMLTLFVVFVLAQRGGRVGPSRLVLAGVAVSYLATAGTSFVQLYTRPAELRGLMFWILGSFASASWGDLGVPTVVIAVTAAWLLVRARSLNVMSTGDDSASALGVDVNRFRIELLIISSLLTACAVAVAGGIGFVGLMVPHACRFLVGPDHRRLLPVALLTGASFMVVVDLLARVVDRPNELPVGIFTAAVGAPFFLVLMRRSGATR
jgi:iron complex transport system permease protein